jgi:hypothetical protein
MHGGAEWAMDLDDVGDVTLFYPEDPPVRLLAKEVAEFFKELGRAQTAFTKNLLEQAKKK